MALFMASQAMGGCRADSSLRTTVSTSKVCTWLGERLILARACLWFSCPAGLLRTNSTRMELFSAKPRTSWRYEPDHIGVAPHQPVATQTVQPLCRLLPAEALSRLLSVHG